MQLIMTTLLTLTELLKPGFTAVVTGASSGIGRAACLAFADKGMNVWMVDIDAEELGMAKTLVQGKATAEGQKIMAEIVDVSDTDAMAGLADKVYENGGKCHVLMNNAGIGLGGGAMTDMKTVQKTVGVNTYGPMNGCLAFVPKMKKSGEPGFIVNTGSKQGITFPPGNLVYNLSKAALKCYTEGLEHELMLERKNESGKLRAALLVPGWVNTSILLKAQREETLAKGETFDVEKCFFHEDKPQDGAWMPSQVIDFMTEELDKGRFYIICPDNDVDRATDNLRMEWTMNDIIQDRPPLSRWHPDFKEKFTEFVKASKESK